MPRAEEKKNDEDEHEDLEEEEKDLGYFGHLMKKEEVELTEEEKLRIEEEDEENILSVAFMEAQVKEIISPHSFSILAKDEPHVELAEPVIAKARQVFENEYGKGGSKETESEAGHETLPRRKIVPMLVAMGYDGDKEIMENVVERMTQKEEFDIDEWCMFLEKYHAPAYNYGQILRMYCGRNEEEKVKELVVRGCDVNTGDGEGLTPLHYAAELNRIEIINTLHFLGKGNLNVNAKDKYGWSPLHSAAHQGCADAVQALLKLGADAAMVDIYGKTPLHYAASQVNFSY